MGFANVSYKFTYIRLGKIHLFPVTTQLRSLLLTKNYQADEIWLYVIELPEEFFGEDPTSFRKDFLKTYKGLSTDGCD
jgi:hypothetical protein